MTESLRAMGRALLPFPLALVALLIVAAGCRDTDKLTSPVDDEPKTSSETPPEDPSPPVTPPEACPPACPPDTPPIAREPSDRPIPEENARPGDPDWDEGRTSYARQVELYADTDSVLAGESVGIRASSDSPGQVQAEVFRMGWYGGDGARKIWTGGPYEVTTQPACPQDQTTGLIECNWAETLRVPVGEDWVSGIYLVKLTRQDGFKRYASFIVRDDRAADIMLQAAFNTYQAYNAWGNSSLYTTDLPIELGMGKRVSYDRPYRDDEGAGQVLRWELHLARFLERHGYDVTYATNLDFERHPNLLEGISLFVHGGHDEYWTSQQRAQVDHALTTGRMSLAHFGGNGAYWRSRLEPSSDGRPNRVLTCFKNSVTMDPIPGSTVRFRDEPGAHPESLLFGSMYVGWQLIPFPLVVGDPQHWLMEGTGLTKGTLLHGLLGYEADRTPPSGVPEGTTISLDSPMLTAEGIPTRSQVVDRTLPSGRMVFSAGTIYWPLALSDNPELYDARVARMTLNVLERGLSHVRPPRKMTPKDPSIPVSAAPKPMWGKTVEPFAGLVSQGGYRDGPIDQALFNGPTGLAMNAGMEVIVADTANHRIRLVTAGPDRQVLTLAGNGLNGFRDGPAAQAMFRYPTGVAVGPDGSVYVADSDNHLIRRIALVNGEWMVSTWAGGNRAQGFRDGPAEQALFRRPTGITADASGNLYVADQAGNRIRYIDAATRQVSTLAGSGSGSLPVDSNQGALAAFNNPSGVALGEDGNLYVFDAWQKVRRIALGGSHAVQSIAGREMDTLGFADGAGSEARFRAQMGLAVGIGTGYVYVADTANHRIRKVVPGDSAQTTQVYTFAGSGKVGTRLGSAAESDIVAPAGLVAAPDGTILVSDSGNNVIRRIVR